MNIVDDIILEAPRIRTTGRRAVPVEAVKKRDLTPADMAILGGPDARPTALPRPIDKLRERHHALARALAGGMSNEEAAIVTGYDPGRISTLTRDPSFSALLDFYRGNLQAVFADLHQRMAGLSLEASNKLSDLLEDDENKLSANVLLDILKATADRTGYAPKTKVEAQILHLTPEDLKKLNHETQEKTVTIVSRTAAGPWSVNSLPSPEPMGEVCTPQGQQSKGLDVSTNGGTVPTPVGPGGRTA